MSKELNNWYKATDKLAKEFAKKYFADEDGGTPEYWWVADDTGGILYVNDYYFNINDIVTAIENEATFDQLVGYYELQLEAYNNKKTIASFKNYIKYGFTYV